MGFREGYTPAEWETLQFGPLWVFTTVASADKNIDAKELEALAKEIQEAPLYKDPLVRELLMSVGADLSNLMTRYQADSRNVMVGLQDVAALLKRKASAENADNFKKSLLLIGGNVAKASGGGLFKRDPVSDEEKKALLMIAMWLDLKLE
ncbi:MAG: hypothetical protein L0271_27195 [Gemmatimonadetes bacterium]|nr:hypothetical protein [Gemmatimonadota bacterium]